MTDEKKDLPQPAPEGPSATAAAPTAEPPTRRTTLPAAPAERRVTEIDKQRVPMAAKPYRLLALVKQDAVVRVQKEPDDTVMTWPHLLAIEFFAAGVMTIFLLLMGIFINAPLEDLANPNVTPAVAKAPWYFVGLQELLAYFHPTVAGVLTPTFVLVGAALVPFIDRGPKGDGGSTRPRDRKVGVMLFTLFCIAGLTITFIGAIFRGPGYSWTLPIFGLHFAL
ncbi:MAG: menaquinol oxidoreductase [Candidatus Limnocylindrales bacterium]